MRNVILIIIFLIFTFFVNVVFFYVSSDYRNFLQNFKNERIITELENNKTEVVDDVFIEENDDFTIVTPNDKNDEIFTENKNDIVEVK
ncbi:MAG: hypothetical protein LBQ59_03575 [Candidatus Peribacteria bacterium]|jgi:hypothetical protein|nr:hypothetical protein [Candidatus Peribacteria bacterium]